MKAIFLLLFALLWTPSYSGKVRLPLARDAIVAANKQIAAMFSKAKNGAGMAPGVIPRSLAGQLPPAALNSILSNAASLSDGKGPLTILPPRVVSPNEAGDYEKDPTMALRKPKRRRLVHRGHRALQSPYILPGPGYMDVGSNGFSAYSYAMMNQQAASMSPFIPRSQAPPPIRIQLQDPLQDNYKRNILSEAEAKINKEEVTHLQDTLVAALKKLKDSFSKVRGAVADSLDTIGRKAQDALRKKQSSQESARNMEAGLDRMKRELMREKSKKELANLLQQTLQGVGQRDKGLLDETRLVEKSKPLVPKSDEKQMETSQLEQTSHESHPTIVGQNDSQSLTDDKNSNVVATTGKPTAVLPSQQLSGSLESQGSHPVTTTYTERPKELHQSSHTSDEQLHNTNESSQKLSESKTQVHSESHIPEKSDKQATGTSIKPSKKRHLQSRPQTKPRRRHRGRT